jgi:hypothetical protein
MKPTAGQVKMNLEALTMERGIQIVGLHSVELEDGTVRVIFDIDPDETSCGLHFNFPLPELVTKEELSAFALWLMMPVDLSTVTKH